VAFIQSIEDEAQLLEQGELIY